MKQKGDMRMREGETCGTPASVIRASEPENVRLSPLAELTIAGGLGMMIVMGPNIVAFIKRKYEVLKTRVLILKDRLSQAEVARKLEVLNRRRKFGSIVRVIGSILPDSIFTPPCRIYIPNWAQLGHCQWTFQPGTDFLLGSQKLDPPSENLVGDGLIEAFEIGSEVISSVSGDEDEETASSSPEGWTQEQRFVANYNPTLNATDTTFARCSTPRGDRQVILFNASQASQLGLRTCDDPTEITELRKMVEGLMIQISCLNQSLKNQTVLHPAASSQINIGISANQNQQVVSVPTPPPPPSAPAPPSQFQAQAGPPPPPPPPPPPMPPMPTTAKLVITKKGNQNQLIEKKPQMSLSDVLKELPNAKLRRVERSPGGTPVKPQLKLASENISLDIGSQLQFALKKRFESMHSPLCETEADKENVDGSDDSFEDGPISLPAKRTLFSPRPRSNGTHSERMPFGQHLLKKRNNQEDNGESPSAAVNVLRDQN